MLMIKGRRVRSVVLSLTACIAFLAAGTQPAAPTSLRSDRLELGPCADDPAFRCGTLPVPLDRRHPDGRTVPLHVEVFPHTGPAAAPAGAVFVTLGGPGASISAFDKYPYVDLLSAVAETRDLVFVDQRGVGLSAAIDCPDWQHGGPFYASAAKCHDQLGDAANLYSTTDVADDLEQVRRALAYGDIDLVGASYAANDMVTYATRWKQNVRSISLGAPALTVDTDPFYAYQPKHYPALVNAVCGRSPACAAANPDPAASLTWLADRLRRTPVSGVGVDSHGVPHRITVTENLLATAIMPFNGGSFVGPGEITQAAVALQRGDPVPLLRLAADVDPANGFDAGDPREFSNGHALARMCVDQPVQWDKDASPARRHQQYAAAFAAEPARYGPISKGAWDHEGYLGFQPLPCIASSWEDRPSYPSGTKVRGVPALIVTGEYDVGVTPEAGRIASRVLVGSTYVELAAVGHATWFTGSCGTVLLQRFIETLAVGDTSCARTPPAGWWMPGSFPLTAATAPPARQTAGPPAATDVRRLATVTAETVMDGLQHIASISGLVAGGLRGGTVTYDDSSERPFVYDAARFTRDVSVSGSTTWTPDGIDGTFTVCTPAGTTASATVRGAFTHLGGTVVVTLRQNNRTQTFEIPGY
ncbi:alpha/beta hydrolase family protein [Kribbella rubisoli]|uniref:Alpha/beta hydrolase family protein n=1 Tax=Kribbella rubisoli TaxID=3075929 RepID=A0A4Q7WR35_9ACTN|nr:alpha/beta fold hydrolase [Kribbella rubisoli]RZU12125.1 alpha/beta hydrolase family protein [Kribbella rubisoli]